MCESSGDARVLSAVLARMADRTTAIGGAGGSAGGNGKKGAVQWIGEAVEDYLRQQQQ